MNRGFMALGYIIVLFVAVVSISFFFSMRINNNSITRKRVFLKGSLDSLKLSIDASLKSQSSWNNTVTSALNKNGAADLEKCMNDPSYVCPMGEYPLSVMDDLGAAIVDSSAATKGFDTDFKICDTYGTPNSPCYIRYELTWQPQCPATGLCYSPPILVSGKLLMDPTVAGSVSLNTSNYDYTAQLR